MLEQTIDSQPEMTLIIQPTRGWSALRLGELWDYRDLLYFMTWRDLKARYRQTALGALWIVLAPLLNTLLYTVIFGGIAQLPSEGVPYALFTFTAMLPWTFFASTVNSGVYSLLGSKDLITKVYFPRLLVPLSQMISLLVDFAMSFLILLGLLVVYGYAPTWGILLTPLYLAIAGVTGLGVGLWFAGIIVKYRDFGQMAGYLVRAWMFATPVVFALEAIPEPWRTLMHLNPMTGVVEGFRRGVLGVGTTPNALTWIAWAAVIPLLVGALFWFRRVERDIVDVA